MKRYFGSIALALFLILTGPIIVFPAAADDADSCAKATGGNRVIACTNVIKSGRWRGPDLAWAYVNRGNGRAETGDLDLAIMDYTEAIRLDPKQANAFLGRGSIYNRQGNKVRSVADYRQAFDLDASLKDRWGYLVDENWIICSTGEPKDALSGCTRVIDRKPSYSKNIVAAAYVRRGNAFLVDGPAFQALADFEAAIIVDPRSYDAYAGKGNYLRTISKFQEALESLNKAIEIGGALPFLLHVRARIHNALEDYDKALADLDASLSIEPNNKVALVDRALTRLYRKELEKGLVDIENALKIDPRYGYGYSTRGQIFLKQDKFEEAEKNVDLAFSFSANDEDRAFARLLRSHIRTAKLGRALDKFADSIPESPAVVGSPGEMPDNPPEGCDGGEVAFRVSMKLMSEGLFSAAVVCTNGSKALAADLIMRRVWSDNKCYKNVDDHKSWQLFLDKSFGLARQRILESCRKLKDTEAQIAAIEKVEAELAACERKYGFPPNFNQLTNKDEQSAIITRLLTCLGFTQADLPVAKK